LCCKSSTLIIELVNDSWYNQCYAAISHVLSRPHIILSSRQIPFVSRLIRRRSMITYNERVYTLLRQAIEIASE
jgi:hypothetical protein